MCVIIFSKSKFYRVKSKSGKDYIVETDPNETFKKIISTDNENTSYKSIKSIKRLPNIRNGRIINKLLHYPFNPYIFKSMLLKSEHGLDYKVLWNTEYHVRKDLYKSGPYGNAFSSLGLENNFIPPNKKSWEKKAK